MNRVQRFFFVVLPILLIASAVGLVIFANAGMVYATPDTESAFFKDYKPLDTIKPFDIYKAGNRLESKGLGAGRGFATHDRTAEFFCLIRAEDQQAIPSELAEQAIRLLELEKMLIVDRAETPQDGYRIRYADTHTRGTILIPPVKLDEARHPGMHPVPNRIPIIATVKIEEKWVKEK